MRKTTVFVLFALLLSLATVSGTALAQVPIEPQGPSTPVSDGGVEPVLWSDNPNCADIGYGFGFKINQSPEGWFPLDGSVAGTELTGGALPDSGNEVRIYNVITVGEDRVEFDWESTLGIDAVIVKGGPEGANVYEYDPEDYGDEGLGTPASASGISHVEFCYDYELDVTKDAHTSYTRTYDWDITKTPNADYVGFVGDSFPHEYTITVKRTGHTDSDWAVNGTITIENNTPFDATITGVSDVVSTGMAASVDCGVTFPYTLAAGGTLACTYSADLPDASGRTNTATVTTSGVVGGGEATADVDFSNATITEVNAEVNVTDDYGTSDTGDDQSFGPLGDGEWATYTRNFECPDDPADYTGGTYSDPTLKNIATIDETGDSDYAEVNLTCYAPVLDKDASTSWEENYTWTITKDYDGTYTGFIGDPAFNHGYSVFVDQTVTPQNFKVYGSIYVYNPAGSPGNMIVSLEDELAADVYATVDCGSGETSVTVAPGATESCSYSGYLDAKTDGTNTATGTFKGVSFVTTEGYAFGPATPVGYTTINVTDDKYGYLGSASGDETFGTYYGEFQCSGDKANYIDGVWVMDEFVNTATIDETGQSDDAKVNLTCYAPVLTKDADASYDERHIWGIDKKVGPDLDNLSDLWEQGGYPGSILPWTWYVYVSETFVEEYFAVSGNIYVKNPAGSPGDMTVSLVDQLSDGTTATVDCGGGATSVTVAAGTTETCSYSASPSGRTATENKATGTFNGVGGFEATYPVDFIKNVVNGTATATDTEIGLNESLTAGEGPWDYDKGYDHTCSSTKADYFVDGVYTEMKWEIENWAYVYSDNELQDSDDAKTIYTCDASFVDIYKTTNGEPADPTKDIAFDLYSGTTWLEKVSTLNNGANLQFQTALVPGAEYTICESPVPAGYTFEITVNGGGVPTYAGPPGEEYPTGEIQCFDFTAEPAGTTVTYNVNNRYPGGAPRTPGYWKNWSRCSGGNQADTADRLNDYLGPWQGAGVFLLDDLLPQTIGIFTIDTCEKGVLILDSRSVDKEKNMSNDAAYTLARALLAARLNQDAGACVPSYNLTWEYEGQTFTFEQVLTAADQVLIDVDFDGTGGYLGPKDKDKKDLAAYALWLYSIIDDYNNSELCTGEPSH